MSDVKKQFSIFTEKIKKAIEGVTSLSFLDRVGKFTVPMIQGRVRRGYAVNKSEGPEDKFTPLSKSYIEQRKGNAIYFKQTTSQKLSRVPKNSTTSKYFKFKQQFNSKVANATRSNLNQFGDMIESLRYRLLKNKVEIHPGNVRANKLTAIHEKGNSKLPRRPYLHLSAKEILKIRQLYEREIRSAVLKLIK